MSIHDNDGPVIIVNAIKFSSVASVRLVCNEHETDDMHSEQPETSS